MDGNIKTGKKQSYSEERKKGRKTSKQGIKSMIVNCWLNKSLENE